MKEPRHDVPTDSPRGWRWHPHALAFLETYGIDPAIVEAAARAPTSVSIDPMSHEVGYLLVARRRGDVVAVCSYRDVPLGAPPMIVYARIVLPMPRRGGSQKAGGGGSVRPRSWRALRSLIVSDGFKIEAGGRHDRVIAPNGELVATLPVTASDRRALANCWNDYLHGRDRWAVRQRVDAGDLLADPPEEDDGCDAG